MRAGLLGLAGEFDALGGVVGAGTREDRRAGADRVDDGSEQVRLLLGRGGGRLARGPGDDQQIAALVDQVRREAYTRIEVELSVGRERRHHRDAHRSGRGHTLGCHGCQIYPLVAQVTRGKPRRVGRKPHRAVDTHDETSTNRRRRHRTEVDDVAMTSSDDAAVAS